MFPYLMCKLKNYTQTAYSIILRDDNKITVYVQHTLGYNVCLGLGINI